MTRVASIPLEGSFGRNPRIFGGNLRSLASGTVISLSKEITVKIPPIPSTTNTPSDPAERLQSLITAARAEIAAADAEAAKAEADMEAIEPHPHAHGYTAGGDSLYAGFRPEHRLPLAGLLARPWEEALSVVEATAWRHDLRYLLKAFPFVLDDARSKLADEGVAAIVARAGPNAIQSSLEPMLAIGMVWHLFGFHHRDRIAWMGAFSQQDRLVVPIQNAAGVTHATAFGDALAAAVTTWSAAFEEQGFCEKNRRAAIRNAERQASWSAVPNEYREDGAWRERAPTKRQRHLMRKIEAKHGLPMTDAGRRGTTSDWITAAGGNPRFDPNSGEKA